MTPNENIYQSPESYQENPLASAVSEPTSKKKFKIPTDPKLKALFFLAAFIAFLIPISLISLIVRKKPATTYNATPTVVILPSPTPTSAIAIPNELQFKLDQINKLSLSPDTISVPQIDENIGIMVDN